MKVFFSILALVTILCCESSGNHFPIFNYSDLNPMGSKSNPNQGLDISLLYIKLIKISHCLFQLSGNHFSIFINNHFSIFINNDLDFCSGGPNVIKSLHISLLYTKFDYNISFLTLVILQKPFSFFSNSDLNLDPKVIIIEVSI
jgi:hypothetical protein